MALFQEHPQISQAKIYLERGLCTGARASDGCRRGIARRRRRRIFAFALCFRADEAPRRGGSHKGTERGMLHCCCCWAEADRSPRSGEEARREQHRSFFFLELSFLRVRATSSPLFFRLDSPHLSQLPLLSPLFFASVLPKTLPKCRPSGTTATVSIHKRTRVLQGRGKRRRALSPSIERARRRRAAAAADDRSSSALPILSCSLSALARLSILILAERDDLFLFSRWGKRERVGRFWTREELLMETGGERGAKSKRKTIKDSHCSHL